MELYLRVRLRKVLEESEALAGREFERVYVDKVYVGHDAPKLHRVFRSGQKRGALIMFPMLKPAS